MWMLDVVKCAEAGGNVTVLVFSPVPRDQQPGVARQLMAQQPDVEQVGFVEEPQWPEAVARLQMMGGEFCGNATAALGWVLAQRSGFATGPLEVSGAREPVQVVVSKQGVEVEMPVKRDARSVRRDGGVTIVELEGITHAVVYRPAPADARAGAYRLLDEYGLLGAEAAGVLYTEWRMDGVRIIPLVRVRDTDTLIEETACASGAVAVAVAEAVSAQREAVDLQVEQPSGGKIRATVRCHDGTFRQTVITVPVAILEESLCALK